MPNTDITDIAHLIAAFTDYDDTDGIADDDLDAALLAELDRLTPGGGGLVAFTAVRKHLPGHPARHGESLVRLWLAHRLDTLRIDGADYLLANDALDDRIAAAELARHPRRPRIFTVLYS